MLTQINFHSPVNPELISIRDAAQQSGLSQADLRMLIRAGRLRYLRSGLTIFLRREDVRRLSASDR